MRKIIDYRFLLTPYADTIWFLPNGNVRKRIYFFGFKVADVCIYNHKK